MYLKAITKASKGIQPLLMVSGMRLKQAQLLEKICTALEITEEELQAAKQSFLSSLRGVHDSPGSIESYYSTTALSGLGMTPAEYIRAVEQVNAEEVAALFKTVKLHTVYFLKGVQA